MFSTILVPVDINHKDWAVNALKHVQGINDDKVRIVLLHVAYELPTYAMSSLPEKIMKENQEKIRLELEQLASQTGSNVIAEVRVGHAASTILQEAERLQADLIVIGSHQPGMTDYFIGSTASRVVRHAKCSVLVSR